MTKRVNTIAEVVAMERRPFNLGDFEGREVKICNNKAIVNGDLKHVYGFVPRVLKGGSTMAITNPDTLIYWNDEEFKS